MNLGSVLDSRENDGIGHYVESRKPEPPRQNMTTVLDIEGTVMFKG